jgi:arylsulfatase A-like enzyme
MIAKDGVSRNSLANLVDLCCKGQVKVKEQIDRRDFLKRIGFGVVTLSTGLRSGANAASKNKPNIVFMVADNLGREAVGFYEGDATEASNELRIKTPHLDRLASQGVVFDNCLIGTPLCGPARCGWNTGRHAYRVGLNDQTSPHKPDGGLSPREITIAEILKDAGYDTALFGKWNLGYAHIFNPLHHGFDRYYGSNAGHADYYTHVYDKDRKRHFYRDLTPIDDEGYFDKLFTDEAVNFLRTRKSNRKPFYMNLTFYAPHGPYQTPPGYDRSDDPKKNYKHMVQYLDFCVGRVVEEVDSLGIAENTFIVFLSDQGGSFLNGYGRTLSQHSLKVICNARWNGRIPAGARVSAPWLHLDLYAVFAGFAGAKIPRDRVIDAEDVRPLFHGRQAEHNRMFCWTFKNEDAIRIGDVKLRMKDGKVIGLFDLADDPYEEKNLASAHPQEVARMRELHAKWKKQCESQQTSTTGTSKK